MPFENKVFAFMQALGSVYSSDEELGNSARITLDLKEEFLTEDFTALIWALRMFYIHLTGDNDGDIVDFLNIITRLVFQKLAEDGELAKFDDESDDTTVFDELLLTEDE